MSVNHRRINEFVESLRTARMPPENADGRGMVNIYDDAHDPGGWRKERLRRFLTIPRDGHPLVLFVGEAPGLHGAVVTGVPFSSVETLTAPGFERLHQVNEDEGFDAVAGTQTHFKETTAREFWRVVLAEFEDLSLPMVWNVVPFWPVDNGRNRTPNASDILFGSQWIHSMLALFPTEYVVGVGVKAKEQLAKDGLLWDWVYHPSRKLTDFNGGVRRVAQRVRDECSC